jgi:hypothetical protein
MPTRSPVPIPPAATPAALGTAAPRSSARAVYLAQKRDVAARRGAEIIGPGVAVPRLTCADALALVAWWSREVPALSAGGRGDVDPDVAAWARCALDVRARATTPRGGGAGRGALPGPGSAVAVHQADRAGARRARHHAAQRERGRAGGAGGAGRARGQRRPDRRR